MNVPNVGAVPVPLIEKLPPPRAATQERERPSSSDRGDHTRRVNQAHTTPSTGQHLDRTV